MLEYNSFCHVTNTLSISVVDTDITTSATWTITFTGTVTGGTSATANDDVTINVMG